MSAAWDERVDALRRSSEADEGVADPLTIEDASARAKPMPVALKAAMLGLVALVVLIALSQANQLRQAWRDAKTREAESQENQPVGYVNIYPMVSLAQRPKKWLLDEEDRTMLWSGWHEGRHHWFSVPRGELDGLKLGYYQNGRDVIRPIDQPMLEGPGGAKRKRVSRHAVIYPASQGESHRAYPIEVLRRVEIVNEELGGRPLLINYSHYRPLRDAVRIYDPVVDGRRLMMGATGYNCREAACSLLFDRESDSLWIDDEAGLKCVAGPRRGQILPLIVQSSPISWAEWSELHPDGDLVVGAKRDRLPDTVGKPRTD